MSMSNCVLICTINHDDIVTISDAVQKSRIIYAVSGFLFIFEKIGGVKI